LEKVVTRFAVKAAMMIVACLFALTGCAALNPKPQTMAERLESIPRSGLPLEKPVTIRWNKYQVPFVEAETDRDLGFALGMVHGHLRLGQIRLAKQLVLGRLSEMAGPFAHSADHSLRILEIARAAPEIVNRLSPSSRAMLESFVGGLNYYQSHMRVTPPEFALLGLDPEPFTAADLVAIARLGSIDVNWGIYLNMLRLRDRPDWQRIWARALQSGSGPVQSYGDQQIVMGVVDSFVKGTARWGSNAIVVSPSKSASGSALIAGDPHLGLSVPNLWVLAGMRSPSYAAVGFMLPGLPVIAEGRSYDLAWAGTNMHAANSDLFDISSVRDPSIRARDTTIKTRFWFDITRRLRTSRFGSIISDSPLLSSRPGETIALNWIGYQPTDEIGSLLKVMRARDVSEFHGALSNFAVSPQNFLCADGKGNICHVLATILPKRAEMEPRSVVLDASDETNQWRDFADARTLPYAVNPAEGFLVSANNRPAKTPYPISYFFSADNRVKRMQSVLGAKDKVALDDLKALQQDTLSPESRELAEGLTALIESIPEARSADAAFLARLKSFDGDYRAEASGPVAFETLLYRLVPATYGARSPAELPGPYADLRQMLQFLISDLMALDNKARTEILTRSIKAAAGDARKYPAWGDMHRLRIQHWFANMPLVGKYFVYGDYPAGGSRETLMKTAHGLTNARSYATYGSQARFVSDLGDPDSSEFAMIGGNDGWLGSENALDQIPLWLQGKYIKMPLTPPAVAREFPVVTRLSP
jgi:penicillin G amidase